MRKARLLAVALVAALAVGCYGKFPITKAVYEFNGKVQDKWARSLLQAPLILWVEPWTALGDWIIANPYEFYTGKPLFKKSGNALLYEEGPDSYSLARDQCWGKHVAYVEHVRNGEALTRLEWSDDYDSGLIMARFFDSQNGSLLKSMVFTIRQTDDPQAAGLEKARKMEDVLSHEEAVMLNLALADSMDIPALKM